MPYWLQDLWKDHKGKVLGYPIATILVFCGIFFPVNTLDNVNDIQNSEIAGIIDVMATDSEVTEAIAEAVKPLATKTELAIVDDTIQAHLLAYAIYCEVTDKAIADNITGITRLDKWVESHTVEWSEFLIAWEKWKKADDAAWISLANQFTDIWEAIEELE